MNTRSPRVSLQVAPKRRISSRGIKKTTVKPKPRSQYAKKVKPMKKFVLKPKLRSQYVKKTTGKGVRNYFKNVISNVTDSVKNTGKSIIGKKK
jgi:hypothetical protein